MELIQQIENIPPASPVRHRGLGLARVDGMGFFICRGGELAFMAGERGREVWAGELMGKREEGLNFGIYDV
ncbi:MAG: hypothetical protein Q8M95_11035 [Candidatus Methanoperedens sp.]|nr:hypothetical protein [Candidatus Methanoperedens sp.]